MDLFLIAESPWLDLTTIWSIARVVLGLGFVVFVHELGHFLVAKMCGVKCEKFYIGFDFFDVKIGDTVLIPRALMKWQWGETEYGVGVVPLGGYVKMLGQDDNPSNIEAENQRSLADGKASEAGGPIERDKLDPRSYQAKSVLQRMSIISAGVIFNIIFAVLMAMIAFRSGVNYQPAVCGTTVAGGPGWQANMDGSTIVRIGPKRFDVGYAPFIDVGQEVALQSNGDNSIEVEFIPYGESKSKTMMITGSRTLMPDQKFPLLGLSPDISNKVTGDPKELFSPGYSAENAKPPFEPNDEIIAINGADVSRLTDMKKALVTIFDQDAKFRVRRAVKDNGMETTTQEIDITVPPNPMNLVEFSFSFSPIVAIRDDSPAARAGIKVGDKITAIDGLEIKEIQAVDQRIVKMLREGKETVDLSVIRDGSTDPVNIIVEPVFPLAFATMDYGPFPLDSLGVAIEMQPVISFVQPGSHAAEVGLLAGDEVTNVEVVLPESEAKNKRFSKIKKEFQLSKDGVQIGQFLGLASQLPLETKYKLTLKRNDQENASVQIESVRSQDLFLGIRGISMTQVTKTYTSASWGDALILGAKQVKTDLKRIGTFLGKLVTGQMSMTTLGGIGTIGIVATMEANNGTSRLLLFLTMLSANLAIVNLLPIPVLDGGHLMFLTYEGIMRRPVTERVQIALSYLGLFLILGLMLFAIFMDVTRIAGMFT